MNAKTTVILLIIAVLGLAALFGAGRLSQRRQAGTRALGSRLFPDFPVNEVCKLTVRDSAGTLTVERGASYWTVADGSNFRAEFGIVSSLLASIYAMKSGQEINLRPENYQSLKVAHPDQVETNAGCLVEAFLEDGSKAASFILGRTKMRSQEDLENSGAAMSFNNMFVGQYIRLTDEVKPMLVSTVMPINSDASRWQDRTVLGIRKEEIARLEGPDYSLEGKDGEFTWDEERQPNSGAVTRLTGTLGRLEAKKALPREQWQPEEGADTRVLKVVMNDGLTYTLTGSGRDGGEFWLTAGAAFEKPDTGTNEVTAAQRQLFDKAENQASLFQDWFGRYAYEIDKAAWGKLFVTGAAFLQPEAKAEEAGGEEQDQEVEDRTGGAPAEPAEPAQPAPAAQEEPEEA